MEFVNLTPHAVNLCNDQGQVIITFLPSGSILRLQSTPQKECKFESIPSEIPLVECQQFTDVLMDTGANKGQQVNFGKLFANKAIIVSMPVGQWLRAQLNPQALNLIVLGPDTGLGVVRGSKGEILGTKRFEVYFAGQN